MTATSGSSPAIIERHNCRLCGNSKLESVLNLGNLYVSTFLAKGEEGIKAPLHLVHCNKCDLLQLKHTAPQEIMYKRHYWYKSAMNPVIEADLKEIAEIANTYLAKDGGVILDIGANDGTLLKHIRGRKSFFKGVFKVGCEPAANLQEDLEKHADSVIPHFWDKKYYIRKKAKVITAIGMFYDLEDPGKFIRHAADVLADDGVFIAQLMTLKPMVENNDVGNICHEHLEFYSIESLVNLFHRNGLEIFKIEENSINGGSYRIFAKKTNNGMGYGLTKEKYDLKKFAKNIEEEKEKTVFFIKDQVKFGKKVYVYGASTKGNTILQYYGMNNKLITGAADKDEDKWGKVTVGTNIPIVSEEEARKHADIFWILPWGFTDSFVKKEKAWRKKGGRFIVSTPHFRII